MTAIIKKVKVYKDCKRSNNSLQISKWNVWPRLCDSNIVCLMHLIYKQSWIYMKWGKIYKTEDEYPCDSSREMLCLFILLHASLHSRYFCVLYYISQSIFYQGCALEQAPNCHCCLFQPLKLWLIWLHWL